MSKFRLRIYRGPDKTSIAKWLKQDELANWSRYQYFYCDGNESIISLYIGDFWQNMLRNKQTHYEQGLKGQERLLQGKYISNATVPFYVEVDIRNEAN
ncbi:hypothetical protein [Pseudoalteromonas sp. G4]|uniref:hypothetical protein n=1 Tax=Pseudoalteromonas sp. G4 TaxID=2992761 RepID=UPI00237EC169|nr:hypothetical protein [Pseudoalteromonas sp. G4]MDE3270773.1 hypothetical protein [Pseudoalteromonas sp. G4]